MKKKYILLIILIILYSSINLFANKTKTYIDYVLGLKFDYPAEIKLYNYTGLEDRDFINHKYIVDLGINNIDELNASPYADRDYGEEFDNIVLKKKGFAGESEEEWRNVSYEYFEYKNKVIGQILFGMNAPNASQSYSRGVKIKIENYFVYIVIDYFDYPSYSIPERYPEFFYREEYYQETGDPKHPKMKVWGNPRWKEPVGNNYVKFYNMIKNKSPKAPQELVKLWEYFDVILNSFELFEPADFVTPSVDRLSLRKESSLESSRIRLVTKGEKLKVLDDIDPPDLIDGAYGFWVKVRTEKGEIGWCFDAYLIPYDKDLFLKKEKIFKKGFILLKFLFYFYQKS